MNYSVGNTFTVDSKVWGGSYTHIRIIKKSKWDGDYVIEWYDGIVSRGRGHWGSKEFQSRVDHGTFTLIESDNVARILSHYEVSDRD